MPFVPKRVYFEKDALKYPLGEKLWEYFRAKGIPQTMIGSHNRVTGIPGKTPQEAYREAKQTLVVGVRRTLKFESCKPSAHYMLPLSTSCTGKCEYCYLNTTLGRKPYLRVYVNLDEIMQRAKEYIEDRSPETTYFEGAATSDPLPYEPYTGALARAIQFFGQQELGRFRFVTKFTGVEMLLDLKHCGHTRIRFSLNTPAVIKNYEHGTSSLTDRIAAAQKVARAGYPLGFLIAPVLIYPHWQEEYAHILDTLAAAVPAVTASDGLTFEIITHRFTPRAKKNIREVFPETSLPLDEETRQYKYGQFGYGKYIYRREEMENIRSFFTAEIKTKFPEANISYIV